MNLNDAIKFLDSSIRHHTPVDREFLIQLKELLKECCKNDSKGKDQCSA